MYTSEIMKKNIIDIESSKKIIILKNIPLTKIIILVHMQLNSLKEGIGAL